MFGEASLIFPTLGDIPDEYCGTWGLLKYDWRSGHLNCYRCPIEPHIVMLVQGERISIFKDMCEPLSDNFARIGMDAVQEGAPYELLRGFGAEKLCGGGIEEREL